VATQQTPKAPKSALARYAPVIAVVAIVAVVAVVIGVLSGGSSSKDAKTPTTDTTPGAQSFTDVPIFYNEAKAAGTVDKYTWPDTCDTTTGLVKIPILNPPPCTPTATATANDGKGTPGVTADTIKIGFYTAKPDPTYDPILKAAGAYDTPDDTAKAYQDYIDIYAHQLNTYGRKIQLVRIDGSGASTDELAAKADADKAAADGVFAVMGGPAQARSFQTELAAKHIMCIGQCVVAAPRDFVKDNSPYIWGTGPNPEQTSQMMTSYVKNQLVGKDAVYGGDAVKSKPRTFALLSYDTPDGEYKASWDNFYNELKAAGVPMVAHISYFLNPASLAADGRTVATKLKATGATSVIFTGDPIFPEFLTTQMTQQNYFPEWVMAGTVLADTNVFARKFDQQQWDHAFGLQLIPARLPKEQQDSYTVHKWWFGTPPPTDNNFTLLKADVETVMDGIHLAGANLTPTTFRDGLWHRPPQKLGPNSLGTVVTYGNHGYWSDTDYGGLDNAGILYWDPKVVGPDETGNVAPGMYRLVDGGRRYLPDQWPTTPVKLFDPAGTVTIYPANAIPAELQPATVPVPSDAPAANG
jgi:hypothetical protein